MSHGAAVEHCIAFIFRVSETDRSLAVSVATLSRLPSRPGARSHRDFQWRAGVALSGRWSAGVSQCSVTVSESSDCQNDATDIRPWIAGTVTGP